MKWRFITDEDGERSYLLTALRDIARGEEVFYTYGNKDNSWLLGSYGFLLPDNPDTIQVKTRLVYSKTRTDLMKAKEEGTLDIGTELLVKNFSNERAGKIR